MSDKSHYVAYLRDSGGDDQDLSISQQEEAVRAWCVERGIVLTQVYKDQARPGSSTVGREAFLEMVQHFRAPDCRERGVIIWKYSRFARDIDDAQYYKAALRRSGYEIVSIKDSVPDGINGRLFEAAIDWMNARFLLDLSADVKRGQRHLLEQYGAIGGVPPRGFKREPVHISTRRDGRPHIVHRWVPDPEWLDRVRLAWQMRAEGASYHKINQAAGLYHSLNSYKTFFSNRLYIGELVAGETVIENYCDSIIDRTVWDAVQRLNTKNARYTSLRGSENPDHPRRSGSNFILSGLVFCAQCGAPMNGEVIAFKNQKRYTYYSCSRAQRHAGCTARKVPKEILERAVVETLRDFVLRPESLQARQDQIKQQNSGKIEEIAAQKRVQERLLQQIRQKIDNLTDLLATQGTTARSLLIKLDEMEQKETETLSELARLTNLSIESPPDLTAEDVTHLSERVRLLLDETDPETLREILSGLIERVTAERDGNIVRGMVHYFFMPKPPAALGAYPYRHKILTTPFQIIYKKKPRH